MTLSMRELIDSLAVVVEHGSYRYAAREIGISESGLRKRVQRIESISGSELVFVPQGTTMVVLTPLGHGFLKEMDKLGKMAAVAYHAQRIYDMARLSKDPQTMKSARAILALAKVKDDDND